MPADRLITVSIQRDGSRNSDGEWVEGQAVEYRRWATRMDRAYDDVLGGDYAGGRNIARRAFRVRWFSELAAALPSSVTVMDERGREYRLEDEGIREVKDARRRYLDLELVG